MESIIKENIVAHLERNQLISKTQHGFVKGRSCITMDSSMPVDVVFLDFATAFDKVPTLPT